MITQEEYNSSYINPFLSKLQDLINKVKSRRKRIPMIEWYPDTPHLAEETDENGRDYFSVIEFYDLSLDYVWGKPLMESPTVSEAILKLIDEHQESLKLIKPSSQFLRFKKYILSLNHQPVKTYSRDTETLRENGLPYSKFSSFFSNLKKALSEFKVQDTTLGTGEPEPQVVEEDSFEGMTSDELGVIIKNSLVSSEFVSNMTKENVLAYRVALFKAINLLNASPFKNVLKGATFLIGTRNALAKNGFKASGTAIASYWGNRDVVTYYTDRYGTSTKEDKETFATLIHELGHRYHRRFMLGGYGNNSIISLFKEAKKGKDQCYLDHLPKLGDPLNDLRNDWWTVRLGSDDYVLTEINRDSYVYTNSKGQTTEVEKKSILKRITCPSQYGAKNEMEFFAEMVTLIVLDKVKPNQRVVVNKFLQIVNQESI